MERKQILEQLEKGKRAYKENEFEDDIVFAKFINYMKKALLHRKLDYIKHQKYLCKNEVSISSEEWSTLSDKDNFDYSSFCLEQGDYKNRKLKKAINKLNDKQKKVIILYYYKRKKIKYIAQKMQMKENAVKQLKLRAINKLKNYMEDTK